MTGHPGLLLLVLLGTLTVLAAPAACAEAPSAGDASGPLQSRVYLQISPEGSDDLEALFATLEDSVAAGEIQPDPVVIVLHGPEALPFLRSNYRSNRTLVDRAAKLQAFDRIDMRMCETWMRSNGVDRGELLPFVDTIPLAPEEVRRLERDGYLPYRAARPRPALL